MFYSQNSILNDELLSHKEHLKINVFMSVSKREENAHQKINKFSGKKKFSPGIHHMPRRLQRIG